MNADVVTGAAGVVAAGLASPGLTGAGGTGTAVVGSDAALRQILHGLPGVDQVGAQERAASLATRSIKREAKLWALETAELATLDNTARAAWLAMLAGADFIKTSTGKITPAATPPVALVMLSAVRDFAEAAGRRVGVKVAGGIRTAKDAIRYLVLVREIAGPQWLTPDLFRIGASSLLNDLLMQRSKQLTGAYAGPDYFPLD